MEEQKRNIDEVFLEGLGNATEVPPSSVWITLDKQLEGRSSGFGKTKIWWVTYSLLLVVLLVGSVIGYKALNRPVPEIPAPAGTIKHADTLHRLQQESDNEHREAQPGDKENHTNRIKTDKQTQNNNITRPAAAPGGGQQHAGIQEPAGTGGPGGGRNNNMPASGRHQAGASSSGNRNGAAGVRIDQGTNGRAPEKDIAGQGTSAATAGKGQGAGSRTTDRSSAAGNDKEAVQGNRHSKGTGGQAGLKANRTIASGVPGTHTTAGGRTASGSAAGTALAANTQGAGKAATDRSSVTGNEAVQGGGNRHSKGTGGKAGLKANRTTASGASGTPHTAGGRTASGPAAGTALATNTQGAGNTATARSSTTGNEAVQGGGNRHSKGTGGKAGLKANSTTASGVSGTHTTAGRRIASGSAAGTALAANTQGAGNTAGGLSPARGNETTSASHNRQGAAGTTATSNKSAAAAAPGNTVAREETGQESTSNHSAAGQQGASAAANGQRAAAIKDKNSQHAARTKASGNRAVPGHAEQPTSSSGKGPAKSIAAQLPKTQQAGTARLTAAAPAAKTSGNSPSLKAPVKVEAASRPAIAPRVDAEKQTGTTNLAAQPSPRKASADNDFLKVDVAKMLREEEADTEDEEDRPGVAPVAVSPPISKMKVQEESPALPGARPVTARPYPAAAQPVQRTAAAEVKAPEDRHVVPDFLRMPAVADEEGGGDGAAPTGKKKKTPQGSAFEGGIKLGYETGTGAYTMGKFVASLYIQYNIDERVGLLIQPAVKFGTTNKQIVIPQGNYYSVTRPVAVSAYVVDSAPGSRWNTYVYSQTYDSMIATIRSEQKSVEIDLPLMLRYQLAKNFSIMGGVNVSLGKIINLNSSVSTLSGLILQDSIVHITDTIAPAPDSKFDHRGATPFSAYAAAEGLNATSNPLRIGYTFGMSYVIKDRILIDFLMQQTTSNLNYIPDAGVRKLYSQPNVRFSVGYKLFGPHRKVRAE